MRSRQGHLVPKPWMTCGVESGWEIPRDMCDVAVIETHLEMNNRGCPRISGIVNMSREITPKNGTAGTEGMKEREKTRDES